MFISWLCSILLHSLAVFRSSIVALAFLKSSFFSNLLSSQIFLLLSSQIPRVSCFASLFYPLSSLFSLIDLISSIFYLISSLSSIFFILYYLFSNLSLPTLCSLFSLLLLLYFFPSSILYNSLSSVFCLFCLLSLVAFPSSLFNRPSSLSFFLLSILAFPSSVSSLSCFLSLFSLFSFASIFFPNPNPQP